MMLNPDCERFVFRATPSEEGVVLAGDQDDLEDLVDHVAAEANHEGNRRRQKRLDEAFALLNGAFRKARDS
jgi:hypothetical protein